jgi:large subunit ribosomal protein L10|nr:50S ribosomal protein L10 [Saccharophagus sp. K07]
MHCVALSDHQVQEIVIVAIRLEDKVAIVADVNETAVNALSLVIADARGVTVNKMDALRKLARQNNVRLQVVRNTLARRAFEGTEFECVQDALKGPSIFGFSMEDPGAAARLFKDFAKENEKFEIKALAVGGKMFPATQIDVLATLPTRDQALAMLMSVMLGPITKLARTFNEVPSKITRVIAAVRDQKQEAA